MQDLWPNIMFYVFAGITLFSALMVITQNNPVRCVLFLVLAFLTSAVLWILVEAEFLALILVLVYVGAVMTLFLFVVMMLNIDQETKLPNAMKYLPFGLLLVALLVGLLMSVWPAGHFITQTSAVMAPAHSDTMALGLVLYTDYVAVFELAAVILLVAIVAAITLVHREPRQSKRQNLVHQLMVRRSDRIRLHTMKSKK